MAISDEFKIILEDINQKFDILIEAHNGLNQKFDQLDNKIDWEIEDRQAADAALLKEVVFLKTDLNELKQDVRGLREDLNEHRNNTELHGERKQRKTSWPKGAQRIQRNWNYDCLRIFKAAFMTAWKILSWKILDKIFRLCIMDTTLVFFWERKGQCDSNLAIYLELGLSLLILLKIRYALCSMRYALRKGEEVKTKLESLAFKKEKPGFFVQQGEAKWGVAKSETHRNVFGADKG